MNPSSVEKILRDRYASNAHHTHVSMLKPKGNFQFDRQSLEELWEAYSNKLRDDKDPILGIAEKPQHYLPILVDIDIKVEDDTELEYDEHLYTEEHVDQVIEVYQKTLKHIVEGCHDENLLCVVLEKPIYTKEYNNKRFLKNGFHLHFPGIFLHERDHKTHLLPRVQEEIRKLELFADLGIEDSGTVVDTGYCKAPWLMYGGRKSEELEPYKITRVVNAEGTDVPLKETFKNYRLYDIHEHVIKIGDRVEQFLPRILSIIPYGRQTHEVRHGLISPLKEQIKEKRKREKKHLTVSVEESLKISEQLLPMLADFRAEDYHEWMTIGWILYNIGDGSPQALEQWLEFSARCEDKYDETSCVCEWDRMRPGDFTLGTLRHFAGIDSPEAYKQFKREQAEKHVKESLNGSHNDIAKVLDAEYGNEFVCASITGKCWYQFREHRWEEIEDGVFLREKISESDDGIVGKYSELGAELFKKMATIQDKAEEAMYQARLKQIQKILGNLKSAPYKNNIMREAMEVFYDRRFKAKLDQNKYLIGFKNGVYDLQANIFRTGRPEDFISKTLPIDYIPYSYSDEPVQNVVDFLGKVFPDTSIRKYFLDVYSDIFVGGNSMKKIFFWTGEGDNAKSITQILFDEMLGELGIKFETSMFSGKKTGAGNAAPEMARAAPPVRHITADEPENDEEFNTGRLKAMSGNDKYWARDLFEKGKSVREVTPMFMITIICNKLPRLKYADKALFNRIRVIPYEATFCDYAPDTYEEQLRQKRFPKDEKFSEKIPSMVQAFAWYLLEWRKTVTIRHEPEKVKEATAVYRRQNDIYRQFIDESIIEDDATITLVELWPTFKDWYKEGFPNHSVPLKNDVKDYFDRLWGDGGRVGKWHGYRIRTLQDDVEDGSVIVLSQNDLVNYSDDGNALPPL